MDQGTFLPTDWAEMLVNISGSHTPDDMRSQVCVGTKSNKQSSNSQGELFPGLATGQSKCEPGLAIGHSPVS